MRIIFLILASISSSVAYSILVPNTDQGWTNKGVQPLEWQRVETDNLNFSVVLVNQEKANFTPQLLGSMVDGTAGKTGCNPPQGGWPTGAGFQVNFVESATALNSILAQSNTFNITQSTANATGTTSATYTTSTTATSATGAAKNGGKSEISAQLEIFPILSFLLAFVLA